ncbi:MAG: CBS domain-containing protein [Chloroflexi bacterium]|nr:CBS domain-containing protein [Chloroflexota bacterium]
MLTVQDLMTCDPDTVTPTTTIKEVIVLMNRTNRRQFPVLDENGRLVGIITDRDLRLAVNSPLVQVQPLERLHFIEGVTVGQCMTPSPRTVQPDTPIYEVAGLMAQHKFGGLPVVEEGELIGIITVTDLLEQMALRPLPMP